MRSARKSRSRDALHQERSPPLHRRSESTDRRPGTYRGRGVSQTFLERCRIAVERLRQYRSAVVTAEALVWHHGYKGLDTALMAIEAEPEDFRERVRADLVARLAADLYQRFKQADVFERALLLERWSQRRGQMIRA